MTGFQDGNKFLSSDFCSSQQIQIGVTETDFGCTIITSNEEVLWVGHVSHFSNVIAVALQGKLNNITDIYSNMMLNYTHVTRIKIVVCLILNIILLQLMFTIHGN